VVSFAAIGVVSTAAYVGLYAALRNVSPAAAANALALVITAVGNTAANRRLTFDVRGRVGLARHHAAGLVALAVALALTSVSLVTLDVVAPHRGRLTEIAVLVAANAAATLVRFLLLRLAIVRAASARPPAVPARAFATLSTSQRTRG
jgi:putative flippase GtrA